MWDNFFKWFFNQAQQKPSESTQQKGPKVVTEKCLAFKEERQAIETDKPMSPIRPFLLRAFYDWIVANNCTPHILISATIRGVQVPPQLLEEDDSIVFNISPVATRDLVINSSSISFCVTMSGQRHDIYIPMEAVASVFALEHHRGMIFEEEDFSVPNYNEKQDKQKGFKPKLVVHNKDTVENSHNKDEMT